MVELDRIARSLLVSNFFNRSSTLSNARLTSCRCCFTRHLLSVVLGLETAGLGEGVWCS